MAEKKIQENPLPDVAESPPIVEPDKPKEQKPADKPVPPPTSSPCISWLAFTKMEPNELYRRLLPAVLFVLTFVTVMTMLLIYMDTVALGAAQFRLNMSRDYELARISQGSAPLVAYVRQLHLAPRPAKQALLVPPPSPAVAVLDQQLGEIYNGTFVEFLPSGPRSTTTQYLEGARHWDGVIARAAAPDYLSLRGSARAALACLSAAPHPRELPAPEAQQSAIFVTRVLCLPLYTLLLAAEARQAHYVLLGGDAALPALTHVPYDQVQLQMIEVRATDPIYRTNTTKFLATKNYTVAANFTDSIMYVLRDDRPALT